MSIVALHFLAVGGPTPKAYSAQPPAKTRDFPSVASGSRPQVSGERVLPLWYCACVNPAGGNRRSPSRFARDFPSCSGTCLRL